jgi:hypothetical protein
MRASRCFSPPLKFSRCESSISCSLIIMVFFNCIRKIRVTITVTLSLRIMNPIFRTRLLHELLQWSLRIL